MPIIRITWHALDAHYQAFFMRRCNTNFNAKLIGLTHLAFGNAFNFRRMQAVEFVFVGALLVEQVLYFGECCFYSDTEEPRTKGYII